MNKNVIKKVVKFDSNKDSFYEVKTAKRYFAGYMEENDSEAMMELASLINKKGVINGIKVC